MCNCYVRRLSKEQQFAIRRGAHALDCPVFRESRDPVDKLKDKAINQHFRHIGV